MFKTYTFVTIATQAEEDIKKKCNYDVRVVENIHRQF